MASSRICSSSTSAFSPTQEVCKYSDPKLFSGSSYKDGVKRNRVLKPVDSPRPKDPRKVTEVEESLDILIKLKELSRNSLNGRESRRLSFGSMVVSPRSSSPTRESELSDKRTKQKMSEASHRMIIDLEGNEYYPGIESFGRQKNRRAALESKQGKSPKKLQIQHKSKEVEHLMSQQVIHGDHKSRISERDPKSRVAIIKPVSKSADIRPSPTPQLGLRKIRTSGSTVGPTPKQANSRSSPSTRDASGRAASNSTSPRLHKKMPDQEGKPITAVHLFEYKKSHMQHGNKQLSESISQGRIRIKPSGHQNKKNHLLRESSESSKAKIAIGTASASKYKRHERKHKEEDTSEKEHEKLSPSSVLDASLYQDDLPISPLSVSSVFKEDENLPSDQKSNMIHHQVNLQPSPMSFEEPPLPLFHDTDDRDSRYIAEMLLASKKQILSSFSKDMKFFQHKRIGEQHIFKELFSEIECPQNSNDGTLLDKDSIVMTDLLWRSKAWDGFGSEVPVVVVEIERLIYTDMIKEIVANVTETC